MKVVKCILKSSRIVVLKKSLLILSQKKIKPNNNNLHKNKEITDNCNIKENVIKIENGKLYGSTPHSFFKTCNIGKYFLN